MELRDYLRLLRRVWPLLIVAAVVGALAGGAAALRTAPRYQATAEAFVTTNSTTSLTDLTTGASYAAEATAGYAQIATTAYVLKPVIARLHLDTTTAALAARITATATDGQAVLTVSAVDGSATRAAAIANAVTAQLSKAAADLAPSTGSKSSAKAKAGAVTLTTVDPATAPTTAIGAGTATLVAGGAAGGLVLAVLFALLRELVDTRIRSREDLARVSDAPVLGGIVRDDATKLQPLVVVQRPNGRQAEAYRTLRTNLRFIEPDSGRSSVVVTSSLEGEGKTTTAANLALAVAGLGDRVLLVDADLRRSGVANAFSLDESVGLTDVLVGDVPLEQAIQAGPNGLDVLPAGTLPPNPNEQMQSAAMARLIDRLHAEYDLVVFDSPPLLAVSDAAPLAAMTGGTILVAAARTVRRAQLDGALRALDLSGARILGFVLTKVPRGGTDGEAYGYGYGSAAEPAAPAPTAAALPARPVVAEAGAR